MGGAGGGAALGSAQRGTTFGPNLLCWLRSNSRTLERDFSWSGLCIEASSEYIPALRAIRSCTIVEAVVSASSSPMKFNDGGVAGHIGSMGRTVQPRTFASILQSVRAPATIDYLSLDVEGHEEQVMVTFPFDTHPISVLTVERPPAELAKQLLGHGLRYVCDSGAFGDELWAHVDLLARRPRLMASIIEKGKPDEISQSGRVQGEPRDARRQASKGTRRQCHDLVNELGAPPPCVA